MAFNLLSPSEMLAYIGERLRLERVAQGMTQNELAKRAHVNKKTVASLEAGGNVGVEALVRIAMILGRGDELEGLFRPRLETMGDIERYESSASRQRVRSKVRHD